MSSDTNRKKTHRVLVFLLASAIVGCSDGPPIADVSGVLTYQGKPVPSMLITFKPKHGRPSWGQTDQTGRFTLHYSASIPNGALIGKHKVWLTGSVVMPSADMSPEEYAKQLSQKPTTDTSVIPQEYFSERSSKIEVEIKESIDDLKIDLQ